MKLIRYHQPTPGYNAFDHFFDLGLPGFGRLGSLFNEFVGDPSETTPVADLHEDENHYYVRLELPGVRKNDIDIDLENAVVTISATRTFKEGDRESVTRFSRTLGLPDGVDANSVKADYEEGVLTLTLPKEEARKPRRIAIQ